MLAYRFHPGQKHLFKEEIEKPKPGPNDVILKVRAAGVCHSDLHVLDGEVPFLQNVFTMGHEVCGEVLETGGAVTMPFEKGRLYSVHGPNPGGNCEFCRTGRDHLCNEPQRAFIGLGADGGYAEFIRVPARNIIEVPSGIPPEIAAVATDAVLTPFHALKTLGNVRQGCSVLIIGLGGLGMNGVQIARALGAHVIATDVRESSLGIARQHGAHEAVHPRELATKLKGHKVDVVGDFVCRESTFLQAQELVKPGGSILAIGLGAFQVPFLPMNSVINEIRVQGSFWGTSVELKEALRMIAEGAIRPQVERAQLREIDHWIEELRQGRVKSRLALMPEERAAEARHDAA